MFSIGPRVDAKPWLGSRPFLPHLVPMIGAVPGEFMKFGIVTKPEGEGPPLHEHPNEEQFSLVISGQMHFVLGDEDRVVGPGTGRLPAR